MIEHDYSNDGEYWEGRDYKVELTRDNSVYLKRKDNGLVCAAFPLQNLHKKPNLYELIELLKCACVVREENILGGGN